MDAKLEAYMDMIIKALDAALADEGHLRLSHADLRFMESRMSAYKDSMADEFVSDEFEADKAERPYWEIGDDWNPWEDSLKKPFGDDPRLPAITAPPCPGCAYWNPVVVYRVGQERPVGNGLVLCHAPDQCHDFSCFVLSHRVSKE